MVDRSPKNNGTKRYVHNPDLICLYVFFVWVFFRYRLGEGADEKIQLGSLIGAFKLALPVA